MDTRDPIDAYVRDFARRLRARGAARRRILAEVRAHLLDAADAERCRASEPSLAAERAIARFGLAGETAGQFNGLATRRGVVLRRALVPWVAAVALTSGATASVWAFQPGTGPSCNPSARQRLLKPGRCRAGGVDRPATEIPRVASRPPATAVPRPRAACLGSNAKPQ